MNRLQLISISGILLASFAAHSMQKPPAEHKKDIRTHYIEAQNRSIRSIEKYIMPVCIDRVSTNLILAQPFALFEAFYHNKQDPIARKSVIGIFKAELLKNIKQALEKNNLYAQSEIKQLFDTYALNLNVHDLEKIIGDYFSESSTGIHMTNGAVTRFINYVYYNLTQNPHFKSLLKKMEQVPALARVPAILFCAAAKYIRDKSTAPAVTAPAVDPVILPQPKQPTMRERYRVLEKQVRVELQPDAQKQSEGNIVAPIAVLCVAFAEKPYVFLELLNLKNLLLVFKADFIDQLKKSLEQYGLMQDPAIAALYNQIPLTLDVPGLENTIKNFATPARTKSQWLDCIAFGLLQNTHLDNLFKKIKDVPGLADGVTGLMSSARHHYQEMEPKQLISAPIDTAVLEETSNMLPGLLEFVIDNPVTTPAQQAPAQELNNIQPVTNQSLTMEQLYNKCENYAKKHLQKLLNQAVTNKKIGMQEVICLHTLTYSLRCLVDMYTQDKNSQKWALNLKKILQLGKTKTIKYLKEALQSHKLMDNKEIQELFNCFTLTLDMVSFESRIKQYMPESQAPVTNSILASQVIQGFMENKAFSELVMKLKTVPHFNIFTEYCTSMVPKQSVAIACESNEDSMLDTLVLTDIPMSDNQVQSKKRSADNLADQEQPAKKQAVEPVVQPIVLEQASVEQTPVVHQDTSDPVAKPAPVLSLAVALLNKAQETGQSPKQHIQRLIDELYIQNKLSTYAGFTKQTYKAYLQGLQATVISKLRTEIDARLKMADQDPVMQFIAAGLPKLDSVFSETFWQAIEMQDPNQLLELVKELTDFMKDGQ